MVPFICQYINSHGRKKATVKRAKGPNADLMEKYAQGLEDNITSLLKFHAYSFDLLEKVDQISRDQNDFDVIIWDRHVPCLHAYFSSLHIDTGVVEHFFKGLSMPDIYLYLDVDPTVAYERIKRRGEIKRLETIDFLSKVGTEYNHLCTKMNMIRIDANQDIVGVRKSILEVIGGDILHNDL